MLLCINLTEIKDWLTIALTATGIIVAVIVPLMIHRLQAQWQKQSNEILKKQHLDNVKLELLNKRMSAILTIDKVIRLVVDDTTKTEGMLSSLKGEDIFKILTRRTEKLRDYKENLNEGVGSVYLLFGEKYYNDFSILKGYYSNYIDLSGRLSAKFAIQGENLVISIFNNILNRVESSNLAENDKEIVKRWCRWCLNVIPNANDNYNDVITLISPFFLEATLEVIPEFKNLTELEKNIYTFWKEESEKLLNITNIENMIEKIKV